MKIPNFKKIIKNRFLVDRETRRSALAIKYGCGDNFIQHALFGSQSDNLPFYEKAVLVRLENKIYDTQGDFKKCSIVLTILMCVMFLDIFDKYYVFLVILFIVVSLRTLLVLIDLLLYRRDLKFVILEMILRKF